MFKPRPHLGLPFALSTLLLTACGGGGGGGGRAATGGTDPGVGSGSGGTITAPSPDACSAEAEKDFVLAVANDWYLWYDEMASVDAADFDTAEALLAALTSPLAEDFRDPGFSYVTTRAEDEANFTNRAFVGFGFRSAFNDAGQFLIVDAYADTPAAQAGFKRGVEILAVDGGEGFVTMDEYVQQGVSLSEVFGEPTVGLERGFRLLVEGQTVDIIVAKAEIAVPPLAVAPRTLERPGLAPVGYVHLRGFTSTAVAELDRAFAELSGQGITDLIIDLRYNSGGLISVSTHLMDLLGGAIAEGQVSLGLIHNDKRVAENTQAFFEARPESASPLRIAFITTAATASASEGLINSLAPVVDLALVGSDTAGKAVGQYAFDQSGCDTRLRLVSFETVNGDGLGGYYTGLVDTGRFSLCAVEDTFTGAFGTADDALTAGALAWLNNGSCPVSPQTATSSPRDRALRRGGFGIEVRSPPDRRSEWVQ